MIKLLSILLLHSILFADIDAQIEAIQNASVEERFKLMNAFKHEVIKMRQEERLQAIEKLQATTQNPQREQPLKDIDPSLEQTLPEHAVENTLETYHVPETITLPEVEPEETQVNEEITEDVEENIPDEPDVQDEINIPVEPEVDIQQETEESIEDAIREEVENETDENEREDDD